jgi:hypothetical protein
LVFTLRIQAVFIKYIFKKTKITYAILITILIYKIHNIILKLIWDYIPPLITESIEYFIGKRKTKEHVRPFRPLLTKFSPVRVITAGGWCRL